MPAPITAADSHPAARFRKAWSGCTVAALAILALAAAAPVATQETDAVTAALARRVLPPGQALAEARDYCAARVPEMPLARTAEEWRKIADRMRADTLQWVVYRGEARAWRDAKTRVEWLDTLPGGAGYRVKKLRYEALPGFWVPALLYEPETLSGRVPVCMNVNGHDGNGKAADYKQVRCINLARRGIVVLNPEWIGMGQLNGPGYQHGLINAIDLCGTGGIATHYLLMKRGLDLLLAHPHADPARVAVSGLSGGGWQTIFISSLDTRVTLANPVAGYSSFRTRAWHASDLGDSEQTPCDLATVTDYAQMTAMLAPRAALLTYNAQDDCCFRAGHALPPLLEAAEPVYALFGQPGRLRTHVNYDPGTHNFLRDNRQAMYRMVGDHFFPGREAYSAEEIPCDGEVRSAADLRVPLPEGNKDLSAVAQELSRDLPRVPRPPSGDKEPAAWRREAQGRLRRVVRARDYTARAEPLAREQRGGLAAEYWRLRFGKDWTVPAVVLTPAGARATSLVVADGGRTAAAAAVKRHLAAGRRVVALDPFYLGESLPGPERRAYLWGLMLATVGDRPLGVQAAQLAAAARWAAAEWGEPPALVSIGPRCGVSALVAAGLEPRAIASVEQEGALGSLKELIARRTPYSQAPELFCFGLLEQFDLEQLAALAAPRPVRVLSRTAAARLAPAPAPAACCAERSGVRR